VVIPKKGGGTRKLGIPTLLDRIAQQVVKTHLERILEPKFHKSSFGYRPNRNCHQAVEQSCRNAYKHDFAIDLDIKGFFDNIDHKLLMRALGHYCQDKWVLMYVERWLKAGVVQREGKFTPTLMGTPQGGVISPLLANLFLHVVFDKWMEKYHPEKPFERYADDIVVHCKTEKQTLFMLSVIKHRFQECKLALQSEKTKIVNLRGFSEKNYPKGFDFLGFTIRPSGIKSKVGVIAFPGIFVSTQAKKSSTSKFRGAKIHKRRGSIEELARRLNPIIRGIKNYYTRFSKNALRTIWWQLNQRLLKWVKWEKGLYKYAALKYLRTRYKENPRLFEHWLLARP